MALDRFPATVERRALRMAEIAVGSRADALYIASMTPEQRAERLERWRSAPDAAPPRRPDADR